MNMIVLLKQVPDLVEEIDIAADGASLDKEWMKLILSEYDDHALEQALLLKESLGGAVHAYSIDSGEVDEMLFTATAKGADAVFKLSGGSPDPMNNRQLAALFADALRETQFDVVLTGVQAIDDLDGSVGPLLATMMDLPYVGLVRGVEVSADGKTLTVRKEFPGGVLGEIELGTPAVLGIQAATKPPRYVPIARIRQAMKTTAIVEHGVPRVVDPIGGVRIRRMYKPEDGGGAEILEGAMEEVVAKVMEILKTKSIVR
jgi:electron transfer flavoprotein beta subunit